MEEQTLELERIQSEVARFKASVLSLYKQHIESLSTLPGEETKEPEPAEEPAEPQPPKTAIEPAALPQAQPGPAASPVTARTQPAEEPQEPHPQPADAPEQPDLWQVDFQPSLNVPRQEPGQAQDEGEEALAETILFAPQQPAPAEEEGPLPSIFEGFQGIRFSD